MLDVVAPVFHKTVPEQFDEVMVTDSPVHIVVLVALILGDGGGVTTVMVDVLLASLIQFVVLSLQVAVYEAVVAGVTVMVGVVAPVDHVTVPAQPVAVSVVDVFWQTVAADGEMVGGVGFGLTVITT
jgi:hypothetical protein